MNYLNGLIMTTYDLSYKHPDPVVSGLVAENKLGRAQHSSDSTQAQISQ
jgi:hypothetical protein